MKDLILLITAVLTALIAGLFYAYSCSVNIGLGRLPDKEYLAAMQAINIAIQNPLFFLSFIGTLLLLPLSAWLYYSPVNTMRSYMLLAAAIIYVIGVFGITAFGNVPLNERLAQVDLNALSAPMITNIRSAFEKPWLFYHAIRTIAASISLFLVLIACFQFDTVKQH